MDVRTKRTTPAMLAKKRAQVASDRAKEKAFREERIPLLARLGEVDTLITKYHWAVEMGAEAVVEMREQMEKELFAPDWKDENAVKEFLQECWGFVQTISLVLEFM